MCVFYSYFMDKIENGLGDITGIPLAIVILGTMTNITRYNRKDKAFLYARLLTLLFEHLGFELQGEVRDVYQSPRIVNF